MIRSFRYVIENGLSTEESYPYTSSHGAVGKCHTGKNSNIRVIAYSVVTPTEDELQKAVGKLI